MPAVTDEFIRERTADVTLRDGGHIRVRPIVPGDKARLAAGMRHLSPESRYRRFFSAVDELSSKALAYLTELDYDDHFAWGAIDLDDPLRPGVGVARYVRLTGDPTAAEVAVAVTDDHQRRGIGTLLLELVAISAREHGIERLVATVLSDNEPARALLRTLGATTRRAAGAGGAVEAEFPVPPPPEGIRDTSIFGLLRAAARGEVEVRPVV